jgi:hypothetical protein
MSILSSEPIVLIGAGSEWLWTAVSGIVLSVTFLAIYRQLRGQRAANAFQQLKELGERWSSKRMRTLRLRVATGLKSGDDSDTEQLIGEIADFFDEVDFLHRQGYLETELLFAAHDLGVNAVRWWTVVEPVIRKVQTEYGPTEAAGFERLAREMRAVMAAKGIPEFKTDLEAFAGRIDWLIEGGHQWARLDKELTAGVVRPVTRPSPVSADAD